MTITIRKSKIYLGAALLLWAVVIALFAVDLDDTKMGSLGKIALILSVPAATLTILGWLEAHVTTIAIAFKAGCDTGEVKNDDGRARISQWN